MAGQGTRAQVQEGTGSGGTGGGGTGQGGTDIGIDIDRYWDKRYDKKDFAEIDQCKPVLLRLSLARNLVKPLTPSMGPNRGSVAMDSGCSRARNRVHQVFGVLGIYTEGRCVEGRVYFGVIQTVNS